MGIFSFLNKSEVTKAANSSLMQSYVSLLNNMPIAQFDKAYKAITEAYMQSDIVYSIVSKKANAGARAPFRVYRIKSLKAQKEYLDYQKKKDIDLNTLLTLKEDAVSEVNHVLNDKYANPNPDMSESEYTNILLTYLNLTGNTYEYIMRQEGRSDIVGMYPMPAQYMEILGNGQFPIGVAGYQLQEGVIRKFERRDMVHSKYANPNYSTDGRHLYGLSPISAGWNLIKGSNEGWDALQQMKENRGPRVLAGVESDAIKDYAQAKPVMDSLKSEFNERVRENRDSFSAIFGKLSVHKVGISAEDMEILATEQMTFDRLCNLFKVYSEWFNTDKQSKYDNLEIFDKGSITNGVMPDLQLIGDSRNRWARQNGEIKPSEWIGPDYSVFNELEVDREKLTKWLKDAWWLTPNEKRAFMREMKLSDPLMDKVYLNTNLTPIENAGKIQQTQTGTQEGNQGGSGTGEEGQGEGNQG